MASLVGFKVVDKNSTPVSHYSAESFDNAPTHFSTIMASVVGLEAVDKSSTPVSGNAAEFFDNARLIFQPSPQRYGKHCPSYGFLVADLTTVRSTNSKIDMTRTSTRVICSRLCLCFEN